jgi:hypothetical protein
MWKFSDASIHRKLLLVVFSTSILGLTVACLAFEIYERMSYRASMVTALASDADTLGLVTAVSLTFNDRKSAVELLAMIRAGTNIVIATLYDKQGGVFAEYRRAGLDPGFKSPAWKEEGPVFGTENLTLCHSIFLGGEKVGSIVIISDLSELQEKMARYRERVRKASQLVQPDASADSGARRGLARREGRAGIARVGPHGRAATRDYRTEAGRGRDAPGERSRRSREQVQE